MKVVLDTNVLVSGLLSPYRAPGEIVRMTSSGILELCHDARILSEYRTVLMRPHFGFEENHVEALLDQIRFKGSATASQPLLKPLPDRNDEPFLEVAFAAKASYLVTGNLRHYPASCRQGVEVVLPKLFLDFYRKTAL